MDSVKRISSIRISNFFHNPANSDSTESISVTDAQGAEIVTFYNAAQGTLSYTNAIHSFDLLAEQFSSEKVIVSEEKKIVAPVSKTLEASAAVAEGKFTIDAAAKTLTFHAGTTGRVIVDYEAEMAEAISLAKNTGSMPPVRTLHMHCYFRNKCDGNIKYVGVITFPRAQIDISSVDVSLTPSPTLSVIGIYRQDIHSCIRFSFSGYETSEQLSYCDTLKRCVAHLRGINTQ